MLAVLAISRWPSPASLSCVWELYLLLVQAELVPQGEWDLLVRLFGSASVFHRCAVLVDRRRRLRIWLRSVAGRICIHIVISIGMVMPVMRWDGQIWQTFIPNPSVLMPVNSYWYRRSIVGVTTQSKLKDILVTAVYIHIYTHIYIYIYIYIQSRTKPFWGPRRFVYWGPSRPGS